MGNDLPRRGFLAGVAAASAATVGGVRLRGRRGENGDGSAENRPEKPVVQSRDGKTVIGANLNGRPRRLLDTLHLLEDSGTTHVRAFVDVREKLASGVQPAADPDIVALRRAREAGCSLIVSLKWDFKGVWGDKDPAPVPRPGSRRERTLVRGAARYLGAIGAPLDTVVLGNEPMWETLDRDIRVDDPPIVRFTRIVKDHLVECGDHGEPTYLVGAFNRSHDDHLRTRFYPAFFRGMYDLARGDPDVGGVDLHLHYAAFEEAAAMVEQAREQLPDGTVMATEFSPVFRYAQHVNHPIAWSEPGARFVNDYGLPSGTTAVSYLEYAKRTPRSPQEIADFYDALPWYNVGHVRDIHSLLSEHDVGVGTFGFLQGVGMREEDWTDGWMPFHINFLYQPAIMRVGGDVANAAHPHYIDDYRALSG